MEISADRMIRMQSFVGKRVSYVKIVVEAEPYAAESGWRARLVDRTLFFPMHSVLGVQIRVMIWSSSSRPRISKTPLG